MEIRLTEGSMLAIEFLKAVLRNVKQWRADLPIRHCTISSGDWYNYSLSVEFRNGETAEALCKFNPDLRDVPRTAEIKLIRVYRAHVREERFAEQEPRFFRCHLKGVKISVSKLKESIVIPL